MSAPIPYRTPGERPEPPPPEATRVAATVAKLGGLVGSYRPRPASKTLRTVLIVGAIAFVITVAFSSNDRPLGESLAIAAILGGAVLVPLSLVLLTLALRADSSVTVYENGLVHRAGQAVKVVKWDRVKSLSVDAQIVNGQSLMKCTLVTEAGASVDVDQTTQGVEALRDILERQVIHQRLLPRSVKELAAGRTVTMGAFQLSKTGLAYKDRQLSWKHVERCRADGGFIFVKKRGESEPWAEVIYRDVPNGSLLVLLCEHMRTEAGASA